MYVLVLPPIAEKTPSKVIRHLQVFVAEIARPIKLLRSDNGTE